MAEKQITSLIQETTKLPDGLEFTVEVDANTGEFVKSAQNWDPELSPQQVGGRRTKWAGVLAAQEQGAVLARRISPMAVAILLVGLLDTMLSDEALAALISEETNTKFNRLKELVEGSIDEVDAKKALEGE